MNMRIWIKHICLTLLLVAALLSGSSLAEDGTVRVYLSRLGNPTTMEFRVGCRYMLEADGEQSIPANTVVCATADGGNVGISYNGRTVVCAEQAVLKRLDDGADGLRFTSAELSDACCGDLILTVQNGALLPVLSIDVEEYVRGVFGGASDDDPQEALKAQAIAARSYALHKKADHAAAYDLSDDEGGFRYAGTDGSRRSAQAADDTRGTVLLDGDTPALCAMTESNGGQTESSRNAWNLPLPYLTMQDDPYDLESADAPAKSAAIRMDGTNLNAKLRAYLADGMAEQLSGWGLSTAHADIAIARIRAIDPIEPRFDAPSRLYTTLRFTMDVFSANLSTGKPVSCTVMVNVPVHGGIGAWYALSNGSENSELVEISQNQDSWIVTLRRCGSGVGMSRCGARVMSADHGMRCEDILDFYYPNTRVGRLNADDASADSTASPYALPTLPPIETEPPVTPVPTMPAPTATDAAFDQPAPADTLNPTANPFLLTLLTPEPAEASEADDASEENLPESEVGALSDEISVGDDFSTDSDDDWDSTPDEISVGDDFSTDSDGDWDSMPDEISVGDDFSTDFDGDWDSMPDEIDVGDDFGAGFHDDPETRTDPQPSESSAEATTPPASSDAEYKYVDVKESSRLVLRKSPSKDGEKLDHLHRGDRVRVLKSDGEWAQVETDDGKTGYVAAEYLSGSASADDGSPWAAFKARKDFTVCDQTARARVNVRMRAEPDADSKLVRKVAGGSRVSVLGFDGTWAYVSYHDDHGFIMKKYLKFSE